MTSSNSTPPTSDLVRFTNAKYLGIDLAQVVSKCGQLVAQKLNAKYGADSSYALVCGLGHKGSYGIAIALGLLTERPDAHISVYLIGRYSAIATEAGSILWAQLKGVGLNPAHPNLQILQDCSAPDIQAADVMVECLIGSGEMHKRFRDVITRISHLRKPIVAFDQPANGYSSDYSISLNFPKMSDAEVVNVTLPAEVDLAAGPGEVKALAKPRHDSYKRQNGKVLVIGSNGDERSESAACTAAAANYAGQVIAYTDASLASAIAQADSICMGCDWTGSIQETALLNYVLRLHPEKSYVITGAAIGMVDLELVKECGKVIFIAERSQLPLLLKESRVVAEGLEGKLRRLAAQYNCYVNLPGSVSLLVGRSCFSGEVEIRINRTASLAGNLGGAAGVLSGITAAYASRNHPWLALSGAAFITNLACELATNDAGIIAQLPEAWERCQNFN